LVNALVNARTRLQLLLRARCTPGRLHRRRICRPRLGDRACGGGFSRVCVCAEGRIQSSFTWIWWLPSSHEAAVPGLERPCWNADVTDCILGLSAKYQTPRTHPHPPRTHGRAPASRPSKCACREGPIRARLRGRALAARGPPPRTRWPALSGLFGGVGFGRLLRLACMGQVAAR
jgi:hypothetical protein